MKIERGDLEGILRREFELAQLADIQTKDGLKVTYGAMDAVSRITTQIELRTGVNLTIGRESEISRDLSSIPSTTTRQTPAE